MQDREVSEDRWGTLLRVTRSWRLEWKADQLLERVAREASEFLGLERSVVWVAGREGLTSGAQWSREQAWNGGADLSYSQEVAQAVVHSGRAVFAHDVSEVQAGGGKAGAETRRVYCVPLTASRGVLGALYLDSRETGQALTQKDQEFLEMLGLQAAAALEHALLYQSAITDPLTRLFSHRHFQQEVEQAVRRAIRSSQPLSLAILDLDHFKALNDSCGHEVGNQCLLQVAAILRETLRTTDLIARFGGDEFEILLPNTHSADAAGVAEKIRRRLGETVFAPDRQVTGTIGVAAYPENAIDGQALFLRADEALYRAKAQGRNGIVRSEAQAPALPPPITQRAKEDALAPMLSGLWTIPPLEAPHLASPERGEVDLHANLEEQIDGHRIVRRLGTGASGEVLLVRQPDLDREVALKRPLTPFLSPEQMHAFEREARVTAALDHPGVVTVHTMGKDLDGRRYYTMKPLRGLSLHQILQGRREGDAHTLRTYTLNRLLEILQRASETLAYAHQQGVVHLDLTPTNILVGEFGEVTIIDWGSGTSHSSLRSSAAEAASKPPDPASATGAQAARRPLLAGSPAYLAPEHLPGRSQVPGPYTDVHALGSILYEILTERPPFLMETTRETLEAIDRGILRPPETVKPEAGIDPSLSEICVGALQRDPARRMTAAEFSDRLGRYVRREQEWEIVSFAPGGPFDKADEWKALRGDWKFESGAWVASGAGDQVLVWKVPVPGSFRFIVEAWTESGSELSILGCGPAPGQLADLHNEGYFFEFGADYGTTTKLARHGHDVLCIPGLIPEAGKRYRLELAFEEGWLHCFLDGKRIFTYRELFPFLGRHIGFYTYAGGAHFKPLELHRQNWGLQVPAIRVADDLFRHGSYEAAIERYQQLADVHRRRLEGDEARLKIGLCQARLKRSEAARQAFHALRGTAFEPFAMSEEALLDLRLESADEQPERGIGIFRQLLERFPESQAKAQILEARTLAARGSSYEQLGIPYTRDLEWRLELYRLGRATLHPPANSQIKCQWSATNTLLRLGRYGEALEELLAFRQRLQSPQMQNPEVIRALHKAALASGRADLLSEAPNFSELIGEDLGPHGFAIWNTAKGFLEYFHPDAEKRREQGGTPDLVTLLIALQAHLVLHEEERAEELFNTVIALPVSQIPFETLTPLLHMTAPAGRKIWFQKLLQHFGALDWESGSDWPAWLIKSMRSRLLLEEGSLPEAARLLEGWTTKPARASSHKELNDEILVMRILLSTLGLLHAPARATLEEQHAYHLAGTRLNLARIFLEKIAPEPGALWPHPLWHPEWRLWLALWLEARGEKAQARKIAQAARDPRYGLTHSQPALAKLLERLG